MASRRDFVRTVALTGAGLTIVPRHVLGRGHDAAERPPEHCRRRRRRHGQGQPAESRRREQHRRALRRRLGLCRQGVEHAAGRSQARRGSAAEGHRRDGAQEQRRAHRVAQAHHRGRPAEDEALPRLPRDARQAEGHRRGGRRDAGPHARRRRDGGDGCEEARLRAEAADLVGRGSAQAGQEGEGEQARHADGQPGPLVGRRAARGGVDSGRRDRRRARGARLDEPAAGVLAAGRAAPAAAADLDAAGMEHARRHGPARQCDGLVLGPRHARRGICFSAHRRASSITRCITRSTGAVGPTGASARSATWART